MKKKTAIVLSCAACLISAGAGMIAFSGNADVTVADKTVRYEYALLGDVYEIEAGLVSAKKPDGTAIPASEKSVTLDWAQGSYTFEYKKKIVDLKVYESAPKDAISLFGDVPDGGVAGVAAEFPACGVKSGIVRTDGAPEVGEYTTGAVFSLNGEDVYTVKNAGEAFTYTPAIGGIWQISYTYTDVFGVTHYDSHVFSVEDKKIVLTDLAKRYNIGEKIVFSESYGYYRGEKYAVSVSLTTPSGKTERPNGSYVFGEAGKYVVELSAEIQGETVKKQIEITAETGLASFVADKSGLTGGTRFTNHSNVKGAGVSEEGILFDMTSSDAGFSYNGVIDLKRLGKNKPVISFTTNNSHGGTLSCVEVTLTDVYDAKNSVTVRFAKNGDTTETNMSYDNTLVRASFGSVSTAFNNYYPLKTDAVAWDTHFDTLWQSPANTNPDKNYEAAKTLYAMNFSFDVKTNAIYSYGNFSRIGRPEGDESGVKWWKIAELSSSSLPVQFGGFTTGEVYLSLKAVSGKGDIVLDSIGGRETNVAEEDYEDASSILFGLFDGSIPAVKGKEYPLPRYNGKYISDVSYYTETNGERTRITGNSFVPEKAGEYRLICEGTNAFGKKVSREIAFSCEETQIPIEIAYDDSEQPEIGGVYTVEEPSVTGGHGKIGYTISVNGTTYNAGDRIITTEEKIEIKITATDELGFTAEKIFVIEADTDVLLFDVNFPRTAVAGTEFTFPKATVTYYKTGEIMPYEIWLDGVKVSAEKVTLPGDKKQAIAEYRTELGSKTFTLILKNTEIKSGKDALIFDGEAVTTDEGTALTLDASNAAVALPYRISPNGLNFDFFVLEEKSNFNAVTLTLTDKNGTSLSFTITDIRAVSPKLLINGEETSVSVAKRRQTFSSTASAAYAGKDYYAFSIVYDDWYKATLNGTAIQSYVKKDLRGVSFAGFDGGVYADIAVEEISGSSAEFVLTRIGNQLFYSSGFAYGDVMGPMLYSKDFRLGNANVEKGYTLDVSSLAAYDVLNASSSVSVTLTKPDGTKAYENCEPMKAPKYMLSDIGVYALKIVARDGNGAATTLTCRFAVEDDSAPEISVSGKIAEAAKCGETIALPSASASDESGVTIRVYVFRPDGTIDIIGEGKTTYAGGGYRFVRSGAHRIVYLAEDEYGNVSTITYLVNAEEK